MKMLSASQPHVTAACKALIDRDPSIQGYTSANLQAKRASAIAVLSTLDDLVLDMQLQIQDLKSANARLEGAVELARKEMSTRINGGTGWMKDFEALATAANRPAGAQGAP